MPEISNFYGITIYMFFEDHNPPHFHVYYDGSSALVSILDGAILKGSLPPQANVWLRNGWNYIEMNF